MPPSAGTVGFIASGSEPMVPPPPLGAIGGCGGGGVDPSRPVDPVDPPPEAQSLIGSALEGNINKHDTVVKTTVRNIAEVIIVKLQVLSSCPQRAPAHGARWWL